MKIGWNYSDTWARGIFALKSKTKKVQRTDAVSSTLKGLLSLNPFGNSPKMPKKFPSDEFMTFKYPKRKLLDEILKNL